MKPPKYKMSMFPNSEAQSFTEKFWRKHIKVLKNSMISRVRVHADALELELLVALEASK